ncbi:MAG: AmmeMemoRadiSam system protein B [Nitrospirae bacterium]|nr:AmmeMemoRadiSam system protein B [Nitrospirota bacterium]
MKTYQKNVIARGQSPRSNLFCWKQPYSLLFALFLLITVLVSNGCTEDIKEPAVAGIFYPSDPGELKKTVDGFLSKAEKVKADGKLIALISPHAGYKYSGQVAAFGYKQIKESSINKIILIGPSHRVSFKGASVYIKGSFKTPLGNVKIDEKLAKEILNEAADVRFFPDAFEKEHSLEVQLPFLQTVLGDFTMVPVLTGSPTRQAFEHLVSNLTDLIDERTLLIASTDLSHYHEYQKAKDMDSKIISSIERLSVIDTERLLRTGEAELCGAFPVLITIEVARRSGANLGLLLRYENSGDVTGEKSNVVGYSSIGLFKNILTDSDKAELLTIARNTVAEYVTNGKTPAIEIRNPKLKSDGAVFVTIKKNDSLRGCIGHIQPIMPLYQSVVKNAIAACSGDPRFPPLRKEELEDIEVEISILSHLNTLKNVNDIQVGKHGLVIRKGLQRGLLLPQVATENGWDRETFLEQLCVKAGLPHGAWKNAELYIFTAESIK